MSDFDIGSIRLYGGNTFWGPSTPIYFTLTSIFGAFLYLLLNGFSKTYVKPPNHFPPRGLLYTFQKPNVDVARIEVKNGDFREALERGSRLVRTFAPNDNDEQR